ncbi:MAG: signal peptidase I [Anaerovoracaceae bacterium]
MIAKDLIIAGVIALGISIFIRPTLVRETSMEPTVEPSDYLLLSKQSYTFGKIDRGDVVVFKSDLKLDEKHNKLLIKRVIGLPGDIITISDRNVYINGSTDKEEYIYDARTPGENYNLTVPEGEVFVMGDHREVSIDSRKLGCIKEDSIIGQAVFRLFPFNKIGTI